MQKIHFYFFCFYNLLYRDGLYLESYLKAIGRGKIKPEDRAVIGLWFSTWLWSFVIRLLVIILFQPHFKVLFIGPYEFLIPLLSFAVYHFYFVENDRYVEIYATYKSTDKLRQKRVGKKVAIWMGLPLILIPLLVCFMVFVLHIDLAYR